MQVYLLVHNKAKDVVSGSDDLPRNAGRCLSNFDGGTVLFDGVLYPTVEHAFQAQKYRYTMPCGEHMMHMFTKGTIIPSLAKKMGFTLDVDGWNRVSFDLLKQLVYQKLEQHPATGNIVKSCVKQKVAIYHFSRFDMFWGCHVDRQTGLILEGQNHLGRLLEEWGKQQLGM